MEPCTLSSLKFFTEGVLILSPCSSTHECCQNLLFMPEPRISLFSRARSRSILSSVRCSLDVPPKGTSRTTLGINATGSVFSLYHSGQNKAHGGEKNKVALPLKIMRYWWWWFGGGGGILLLIHYSQPSSYGFI